jgi:hypothetical protein
MGSASGREGQPVGQKVVGWLSQVFALNPAAVNWPRAVILLDVMLVLAAFAVTLASGVTTGVLVMLLAGLLAKRRTAKTTPQQAPQPA